MFPLLIFVCCWILRSKRFDHFSIAEQSSDYWTVLIERSIMVEGNEFPSIITMLVELPMELDSPYPNIG